ncbi:sirohydrochlorin chelatase [Zhihengliuella salsuginis]|uniref:sirohydrochlorin chelatase n=1 Tax=Zhihengliuella salsuginis TaxID=578222 RepID=UPI001679E38B|nr:CbiX/SirB N-terminal domain-containing protein [Zhihengliuella salsuginis]
MSRTDANHSPSANDAWTGWVPQVEAGTLVAASHGTGSPSGQRAIRALVEAVAAARPGLRIAEAFVDVQTPDVPAVLSAAGPRPRIVPLLLSTGYHTRHDLAEAADAAEGTTVTRALGPDPRLADVLALRLREAGVRRGDQIVMACAGSTDPQGVADCRAMAGLLAQRVGAKVEAAFVSAADPSVGAAVASARARTQRGWFGSRQRRGRVVVSTYLMAPGHFAALVAGSDADIVAEPLLVPGLPVPRELVDIVLDRYDQP